MAHFKVFSFLTLILVSQVLGRIRKHNREDYTGGDRSEVGTKRYSYALASIEMAEYLPNADFMRTVLKGIALDLAVLRKNTKKTSETLDLLTAEKSEDSSLLFSGSRIVVPGSPNEENLVQNELSAGDRIKPWQQWNTATESDTWGNFDIYPKYPSPTPVLPQGLQQQYLSGLGGLSAPAETIGQLPNGLGGLNGPIENNPFQRG